MASMSEKRRRFALVMDDDPEVCRYLKLFLQDENFEVMEASNGEDGVMIINRVQPDVIFLDILMSDMSGLEVCRYIKSLKKTRNIPTVIMTEFGGDRNIELAKDAGADWLLKKPIRGDLLAQLIQKIRVHENAAGLEDAPYITKLELSERDFLVLFHNIFVAYQQGISKILPIQRTRTILNQMTHSFYKLTDAALLNLVVFNNVERTVMNLKGMLDASGICEVEYSRKVDKDARSVDYVIAFNNCRFVKGFNSSETIGHYFCPFALLAGFLIKESMGKPVRLLPNEKNIVGCVARVRFVPNMFRPKDVRVRG